MAAFRLLLWICVGLTLGVCWAADPFNSFELELSYITASPLGVPQQVRIVLRFWQIEHCSVWRIRSEKSEVVVNFAVYGIVLFFCVYFLFGRIDFRQL